MYLPEPRTTRPPIGERGALLRSSGACAMQHFVVSLPPSLLSKYALCLFRLDGLHGAYEHAWP